MQCNIIDNKIVVEIKAEKELTYDDEAQLLNYLKATGLKLGFLFNFGQPILEFRRRVATEKFKRGMVKNKFSARSAYSAVD